ncbi:MAG: tRNA pseudouridine(38-40) synthase TruA [Bacteroidales bacterium]
MRYFIRLSYNGAAFCGWQIQENANSVQEELQKALSTLLKEPISVTGAGRTDSGVNAVNYIAHFDSQVFAQDTRQVLYKLNAILPKEICIHDIFPVHADAHARFDAVSRTYKYYIHTEKDPFNSNFSYYLPPDRVDFEKMNLAATYFLGEKEFSSLEKVNGGNKTSICNVTEAFWTPIDATHYVFTVTANRFLRNMVRAMVGSLLEVGFGKRPPEWIITMLAEKNRCAAGHSVPGNALFLYKIEYPY